MTTTFPVPDHLRPFYDKAEVEVLQLRGDAERDWAVKYVRDVHGLSFVGSDPETQTLLARIIDRPDELDRYVTHRLKLEAAWAEYTRPEREAEAAEADRFREASHRCPVCGEVDRLGHRPRSGHGLDVCDHCDRVATWLLMRKAATPGRVKAIEEALGL